MFANCVKLTNTVGINSWDISKVTRFTSMFSDCPSHPEFTKRSGTWYSGTFKPTIYYNMFMVNIPYSQ